MKRGIFLVAALLLFTVAPSIHAQDPPLLGKAAPEFDLPTLDGGQIDLTDLRGRIVVLHFGTGW